MGKAKGYHSISAQFFSLLVALGLICGGLFLILHNVTERALEDHFLNPDIREKAVEARVSDLQDYVEENQVAATDWDALAQWMSGQPLVLMEVYRSNLLLFSSYAPSEERLWESDIEVTYYDWISYYNVRFSDGDAQVLLYSDDSFRFASYALILEVVVCSALFLAGFLVVFQRSVRYIRQINLEVREMEGGDLERPITLRGNNDLTQLAESINAMRLSLREHQAREAKTYATNQALITEMSHDLRTPLTTLLIYTEILRYSKYQGEEQLQTYLARIDDKAQQIKQLAENILAYSLSSQQPPRKEQPRPAQESIGPLLYEMVSYLEHQGFTFQLELAFASRKLCIHPPYLRRILDNVSSNLLKYADPSQPVRVRAWEEQGAFLLRFENAAAIPPGYHGGSQVGLASIQTMMEDMGGTCQAGREGDRFTLSLRFPPATQGGESP